MPNTLRDRKIGFGTTDENGLPLNPGAPTPRQQQEASQAALLQSGGIVNQSQQVQMPNQNVFTSGGVVGRFEQPVNPQPQQQVGTPPYDAQTGLKTPQPQTNFENMPQQPTGWNPDGSAKYDDISKALASYQSQPQQPQFMKDDTKRDGGFFSWLRSLVPKSRPGRRDGESDDDYDRRMTDNRERLLALGDAMRHIGNIVNTTNGAPVQQFNDPFSSEETRYQQRKADREKKAALDAENSRNAAEMSLKEKAAEADRQYKTFLMGMKDDAAGLNRDKFNYQMGKDANEFNFKVAKEANDAKYKTDRLNETIRHNKAQEYIAKNRVAIAKYNAEHKSSKGSSNPKYPVLLDENGNPVYSYNNTGWEYNSARYGGVQDDKGSTSTTTKNTPIGKQTSTTVTKSGSSAASQLGAKDRQKAKSKPSPTKKQGGKKSYTNTKKLGL